MDKRRNPNELSDFDCACCIAFVIGLIVLLCAIGIYSELHGSNPAFVLRDFTMYDFNAVPVPSCGPPGPSYLNTTIQVTISSRVPSDRAGIYYFTLYAYASYRGQQITPQIIVAQEAYQGPKEVIEWSPFLEGNIVPDYLGALATDLLATGTVPIDVKIDGRMMWKHTAQIDPLHVNCPALLMLDTGTAGTGSGLSMKVRSPQQCTVDRIS